MPSDALQVDYYAKRVREYERIYDKPERQPDLEALRNLTRQTVRGHDVLEVVCGTGYWTRVAASTAVSIVATDINEEVLALARTKDYFDCKVSFQNLDAFQLSQLTNSRFTAGMAFAWWSHLRKADIRNFLEQFHATLAPGALAIFMDNRFVSGSSTPISRTDRDGNTYQCRRLTDGTEYEVLKNFPNEKEVRTALTGLACEVRWVELQYYWFLTYRTKP
ncbi:MAG: class I SAM-dependent methyltransferase [Verrucomicrobia bacterium]|nr:class I SAM-dependent methyltransferase [Verrucomicrobiota bacterium]